MAFISNKTKISTEEKITDFQKKLIKKPTLTELIFKRMLLKNNIPHKFQHLIPPYIVDFYLPQNALVIEIDGSVHNKSSVINHDSKKDSFFASIGLVCLHIEASEDFNSFLPMLLSLERTDKKIKGKINKKINVLHTCYRRRDFMFLEPNSYQQVAKLYGWIISAKRTKGIMKHFLHIKNCELIGIRINGEDKYLVFNDLLLNKKLKIPLKDLKKRRLYNFIDNGRKFDKDNSNG